MPRKDGTGPQSGSGSGGRGRMGGSFKAGPGGQCVCPGCGHTVSHVAGQPCSHITCPTCGSTMTRA